MTGHDVYAVEHGARRGTVIAACSCGWSGHPRRSMAAVERDGSRHQADVVREALAVFTLFDLMAGAR